MYIYTYIHTYNIHTWYINRKAFTALMIDLAKPAVSAEEGPCAPAEGGHDGMQGGGETGGEGELEEFVAVETVYQAALELLRGAVSGDSSRRDAVKCTSEKGLELEEARLRAEWSLAVLLQGTRSLARSEDERNRALDNVFKAIRSAPSDHQVQVAYGQVLSIFHDHSQAIQALQPEP
jgi:hypothetical protein